MTVYEILLTSPEWKKKRKAIIARDKHRCTSCGNVNLFQQAIFGYILSRYIRKEWMRITFAPFFKKCYYNVVVPIRDLADMEQFSPMLVLPYGIKNGQEYAHMIAHRRFAEMDYDMLEMMLLHDKRGEIDLTAFELYRSKTYKTWERIKGLEVHHKYYRKGAKPWEYNDEALTTLCWYCHEKFHADGKVPVLDKYGNVIGEYANCSRCHGAGAFPEFSHVQSGICFRCKGAKYEELINDECKL